MKSPLVSICIPTYNRPRFLKNAVDSCLRQTYSSYEIIIADHSVDSASGRFVKRLHHPKIAYLKNAPETSSYENTRSAVKSAKGTYLKILYDDDLLKPDCLKKMVAIMEKNKDVGLVMAPLDIIDIHGRKITPTFYLFRKMRHLYRYLDHDGLVRKKQAMTDFLTRIYPCCVPTGIMFRKKLLDRIGGFSQEFPYIGDLELCMRMAKYTDFYYIDEYLSSWRFSPDSETVAILHKKGIDLDQFYRLTKKYCFNKSLEQEAYLFASKRTAINIVAGIRSHNLQLIIETIKAILEKDKFLLNKIELPFVLAQEVIKSFF